MLPLIINLVSSAATTAHRLNTINIMYLYNSDVNFQTLSVMVILTAH